MKEYNLSNTAPLKSNKKTPPLSPIIFSTIFIITILGMIIFACTISNPFTALVLALMLFFLIICLINFIIEYKNRYRQMIINAKVSTLLNDLKYNTTKFFYINDSISYDCKSNFKKLIAIDNTSKLICLVDYPNNSAVVLSYEEILNFEIYENDNLTTTSQQSGGFSRLGGLKSLGSVGSFSTTTTSTTENFYINLKIILRLKSYEKPQVSYEIIFANGLIPKGVKKSSSTYSKCISSIQELTSFFNFLIAQNNASKSQNN